MQVDGNLDNKISGFLLVKVGQYVDLGDARMLIWLLFARLYNTIEQRLFAR